MVSSHSSQAVASLPPWDDSLSLEFRDAINATEFQTHRLKPDPTCFVVYPVRC
jgi:hypothetical protein